MHQRDGVLPVASLLLPSNPHLRSVSSLQMSAHSHSLKSFWTPQVVVSYPHSTVYFSSMITCNYGFTYVIFVFFTRLKLLDGNHHICCFVPYWISRTLKIVTQTNIIWMAFESHVFLPTLAWPAVTIRTECSLPPCNQETWWGEGTGWTFKVKCNLWGWTLNNQLRLHLPQAPEAAFRPSEATRTL